MIYPVHSCVAEYIVLLYSAKKYVYLVIGIKFNYTHINIYLNEEKNPIILNLLYLCNTILVNGEC